MYSWPLPCFEKMLVGKAVTNLWLLKTINHSEDYWHYYDGSLYGRMPVTWPLGMETMLVEVNKIYRTSPWLPQLRNFSNFSFLPSNTLIRLYLTTPIQEPAVLPNTKGLSEPVRRFLQHHGHHAIRSVFDFFSHDGWSLMELWNSPLQVRMRHWEMISYRRPVKQRHPRFSKSLWSCPMSLWIVSRSVTHATTIYLSTGVSPVLVGLSSFINENLIGNFISCYNKKGSSHGPHGGGRNRVGRREKWPKEVGMGKKSEENVGRGERERKIGGEGWD